MQFEAAGREGVRPAHLHVRNSRLLWSGCPQTYHPTQKPGCAPRAHSRACTGRGWGVSAAAPPRHQLVPPGAARCRPLLPTHQSGELQLVREWHRGFRQAACNETLDLEDQAHAGREGGWENGQAGMTQTTGTRRQRRGSMTAQSVGVGVRQLDTGRLEHWGEAKEGGRGSRTGVDPAAASCARTVSYGL